MNTLFLTIDLLYTLTLNMEMFVFDLVFFSSILTVVVVSKLNVLSQFPLHYSENLCVRIWWFENLLAEINHFST